MEDKKISKKGGIRVGAGRPKGRNAYGEATRPMRIPLSLLEPVEQLLSDFSQQYRSNKSNDIGQVIPFAVNVKKSLRIPLYGSKVAAGFASPADDFVEDYLDLNQLLVKHHEATFFVRVSGHSMVDAGIQPEDILVVDRSLEPVHGKIVIAVVDTEVTVKRLSTTDGTITLKAENPEYADIPVTGDLHIWGVVTSIIHQV
ncbi:MAG: translesion error-prone DNA polymerase V autoproteolytic subunit [Thiotrichaceae bacterium]